MLDVQNEVPRITGGDGDDQLPFARGGVKGFGPSGYLGGQSQLWISCGGFRILAWAVIGASTIAQATNA